MKEPTKGDLAQRAIRARRLRDAAIVLPLIGVFLFLTPIVSIANVAGSIAGLPFIFFYLFGIWLFLIIATYRLSRRLDQDDGE